MSYKYADLVAQSVAKAPPLTPEQLSRLAGLFSIPAQNLQQSDEDRAAA